MRFMGLSCTECQTDDIMAVWPGGEVSQGDLFWLNPHRPVRAWCEGCWVGRFGAKPRIPRGVVRRRRPEPRKEAS